MRETTLSISLLTAILFMAALAGCGLWWRAGADPAHLWAALLTPAPVYGAGLFLHLRGLRQRRTEAAALRDTIDETDRELRDTRSRFQETVERRTFEISVINASLNREIAERIQAENEARALQHRLELILESAGEGIFGLDSEGILTFANKAASEMVGWSAEELVGGSHHSMVHHSHADGSPFEIEACPILQSYRDGKISHTPRDYFWTRDGKRFAVEYTSTPIMEKGELVGAVVVFSDISQRLAAETERLALQRRLELILDSAGQGIFGLDTEGRVQFANRAATVMLGWSVEEMLGKPHHSLVHHSHADGTGYPEEECPIYMAYKDGKVHFKSDDVFWAKDGTSFPVEYVSTPIKEDGRLTGAVVTFRDLNTFA